LIVKKTGLLKKEEALENIDPSGSISRALFELKEREITSPVYTYKGIGIAQLVRTESPRLATFEEAKDEVKENILKIKKKEKALEKMKEIRAQLTNNNMEEVAEKYKLEYRITEKHKRGQYLSIIGENAEIDKLVFSLPLREISQPAEFHNGYVLIRVLKRKEITQEDFEKNKKEEKGKFLEMKKNRFLHSYILKLREEKGVNIKYDLFLKVNSDIISKYGGEE